MKRKLIYATTMILLLVIAVNVCGQNYQFPVIDSLVDNRAIDEAMAEIGKVRAQKSSLSDLEEAELLYHEAMTLFDLGKFEESSDKSKESLELIRKSVDNYEIYFPVAFGYATALGALGDHEKGIAACTTAIEELKSLQNIKEEYIPRLHLKIATLLNLNSKYDLALEELEKVHNLIKTIEDEKVKLGLDKKYLNAKAKIYVRTGRMKESIKMSSNLLKIAIEEKDSSSISSLNNTIALNYFRMGDYGKCKHHVEQSMAVNLPRFGEESPKMMRNYGNMGVVCMKLEDYNTAQEYYNKTKVIIENTMGTENIEMASLVFNLGVSHFQKQEYDEALPKFQESLRLRRKFLGNDHADVAHATQIIGSTLIGMEKYKEAIPYLEKALSIRTKLGNPLDPELTRVYSNLAICYQQVEDLEKAQSYVDAAYQTVGYDHTTPFDFDKLVAPFMFANPLELDIALATDRYKLSGKNEDYSILLDKSKLVDSIQNYLKFYLDDPGSRMVATAKNMLVFDELMNGYYERYRRTGDNNVLANVFTVFEKSKNTLMYEKLAEDASESTIGMPNELIDQKFALEDSIAYYEELSSSASGDELPPILDNLNKAKSAYYAHLNKIQTDYPKFYESVYDYPIASIDEYLEHLNDDEASISYFFGNSRTFALFFKNGDYQMVDCGESVVIDSIFPIFLENLEKRNEPDAFKASAKELYSILIEPFDLEGVQHLNLLVDGVLSLIPFEVLIDPNSDMYLMETQSISYQYSATLQMKSRNATTRSGTLLSMAPVFENIQENNLYASALQQDIFRDELSSLPNSENEIEAISAIFGGTKLSKSTATESAFKKYAPSSHVLHLATHGFVNHSIPDHSRLYFYEDTASNDDGKLHAFEIVNMDLNADLVTLSACNTGVGTIQKGEGVASLGRAFAYAGCPNQLISLWPANDKSTTEIMTNFYKNIDRGDTKALALHNAKKQYLESSPEIFRHPYYWSGFVYYGNDDALRIDKGSNIPWIWIGLGAILLFGGFLFFRKK